MTHGDFGGTFFEREWKIRTLTKPKTRHSFFVCKPCARIHDRSRHTGWELPVCMLSVSQNETWYKNKKTKTSVEGENMHLNWCILIRPIMQFLFEKQMQPGQFSRCTDYYVLNCRGWGFDSQHRKKFIFQPPHTDQLWGPPNLLRDRDQGTQRPGQ